MYVPFKQNDNQSLSALTSCLSGIEAWMSLNLFIFYLNWTEAIAFGSLAESGKHTASAGCSG